MGLAGIFASTPRVRARVLLDISASSIAGAIVALPAEGPLLCYDKRVPIIMRAGEEREAAMERALALIMDALVGEGVPVLAGALQGAYIADVLVSMDAPWQTTSVLVEEERGRGAPFVVTKHVVDRVLARVHAASLADPASASEESVRVIGIRINGYQTNEPYGKLAQRASFVIVRAMLDPQVAQAVDLSAKRHFHRTAREYVSGPFMRYRVLKSVFPEERDMLILDAFDMSVTISLVRAGYLVALSESADVHTTAAWATALRRSLGELAGKYPLPGTILLIAEEREASRIERAFAEEMLGALWLSDLPPRITPVAQSNLTRVRRMPDVSVDIRLAIMARYAVQQDG